MKERVKLQLLAKTIPTPSTVDVVWDLDAGILTLFTSSAKSAERFEELFAKTFENMGLQMIYPYARGLNVLGGRAELLSAMNQAGSDAALDQIKSNRWIGEDLLVWLLANGLTGSRNDYRVAVPGTTESGTAFTAWIDDRIEFHGGGEGGPQKVIVSGSQDKYVEARAALRIGKAVTGAVVYIEQGELQWRFRLDAETFTFSSFRCPAVKIEREGVEDLSEREAAFYERMHLLGQGLQMFDSLFVAFLEDRAGAGWPHWEEAYRQWLSEED